MKRRNNGAGTLIKKPNGTYLAKWTFRGKTYFKTTGESNKAKALKKLNEFTKPFVDESDIDALMQMEAKVRASVYKFNKEQVQAHDYKLSELGDIFLATIETAEYEELTRDTIFREINKMVKWVTEKYPAIDTITKINETIASDYLMWARKHYAPITYNHILWTMKKCWTVLGRKGELYKNVWMDFKKRQLGLGSHRRELTSDEIIRMISVCRNDEERLMITLGIYTGMRIGDCCNLKWSSVDLGRKFIMVVPHKTRKYNNIPIKIPIHNVLLKGLYRAKSWEENEYVLPNLQLKYSRKTIRKVTDKIFAKAGIKVIEKDEHGIRHIVTGFHSLRRTFVSVNINAGMNPFLIQKIVGHSDIDMTAYYYEANAEVMRKGLDKMPDFTDDANAVIDIEPIDRKSLIDEEMKGKITQRSKENKELYEYLDSLFDEFGNPLPIDAKGNPITESDKRSIEKVQSRFDKFDIADIKASMKK